MESLMTLSLGNALALFTAMLVLAAVPSVSVLAVTARAASGGFRQGTWVTLGIVTADTLFIVLAIFGLHAFASTLGPAHQWLRILAAVYLLWLAWRLWRAASRPVAPEQRRMAARSAFMSGLLLTLGDQKAVLFYLGFFPAFIDLARLTWVDALVVVLIAAVAVGGVKLIYAGAAARAGRTLSAGFGAGLNRLASLVLLVVALILLTGV